jgi:hypothetical protein
MNGYVPKQVLRHGQGAIAESQTDSPVSEVFGITYAGSRHIVVAIAAADVTEGDGIDVKLQTSPDGGTTWVDAKSVAVTTDGLVYLRMSVEDDTDRATMPLFSIGRVVATTDANGATVTPTAVTIFQGG